MTRPLNGGFLVSESTDQSRVDWRWRIRGKEYVDQIVARALPADQILMPFILMILMLRIIHHVAHSFRNLLFYRFAFDIVHPRLPVCLIYGRSAERCLLDCASVVTEAR